MTEELRRFIMVDDHEAGNIGDLERTLVSLSVVEPKFSAHCARLLATQTAGPV